MSRVDDPSFKERWPIMDKFLFPIAILGASGACIWIGIDLFFRQPNEFPYDAWVRYEQAQAVADHNLALVIIALGVFVGVWGFFIRSRSSKLNTDGEEVESK